MMHILAFAIFRVLLKEDVDLFTKAVAKDSLNYFI